MSQTIFSFGKERLPSTNLIKSIKEVLSATSGQCPAGWYFLGTIVTPVETKLEGLEITQTFRVAENSRSQETLKVIVGENALRSKGYLSIFKQNGSYRFKGGEIIIGESSDNVVYMSEQCDILNFFQGDNEDDSLDAIKMEIESSFEQKSEMSRREAQSKQQSKKSSIKSKQNIQKKKNLPELKQEHHPNHQSLKIEDQRKFSSLKMENNSKIHQEKFGSLRIDNTEKEAEQQWADFTGKVLCSYHIGRNKDNNGLGYKIEQVHTKEIYEVIVWSEVRSEPLIRGKTYFFKLFKVHKNNFGMSFYSHYQHSSIKQIK